MLNAISLENVGVEAFVRDKLPALPERLPVFASVFGTELDLYAEVCKRVSVSRVVGIEVNASCPHVKEGGIEFGQSPTALAELVRACRRSTERWPIRIPLSWFIATSSMKEWVASSPDISCMPVISTTRSSPPP